MTDLLHRLADLNPYPVRDDVPTEAELDRIILAGRSEVAGPLRRSRVVAAAVGLVLGLGWIAVWFGPSAIEPGTGSGTTVVTVPTTGASQEAQSSIVTVGNPQRVGSPGNVRSLRESGGTLYVSTVGLVSDRVMESTDGGISWSMILEAEPGDSQGLFGAGRLVVQVIEDDSPARDTVAPNSVVTAAPRVLIYDPETGERWETVLPRPDDPDMDPLPLDEGADQCPLGGYQSWVQASGVAVGDRLVVVGHHVLVGRLSDGTIVCGNQPHSFLTWISDDDGRTWELHDGQSLSTIAWTGSRFIAWSSTGEFGNGAAAYEGLVASSDGIDWITVASVPMLSENTFVVGTAINITDDAVIAWMQIHRWTTVYPMPDNVTDPEQLREVLGRGAETDIEATLALIGVDLPLDEREEGLIARFRGSSEPIGAIIVISTDRGTTWTTSLVDEPINGVVNIPNGYIAVTSVFGDLLDRGDDRSALLSSTDGIEWLHVVDLPEPSNGSAHLVVSDNVIYFIGSYSDSFWALPVR